MRSIDPKVFTLVLSSILASSSMHSDGFAEEGRATGGKSMKGRSRRMLVPARDTTTRELSTVKVGATTAASGATQINFARENSAGTQHLQTELSSNGKTFSVKAGRVAPESTSVKKLDQLTEETAGVFAHLKIDHRFSLKTKNIYRELSTEKREALKKGIEELGVFNQANILGFSDIKIIPYRKLRFRNKYEKLTSLTELAGLILERKAVRLKIENGDKEESVDLKNLDHLIVWLAEKDALLGEARKLAIHWDSHLEKIEAQKQQKIASDLREKELREEQLQLAKERREKEQRIRQKKWKTN